MRRRSSPKSTICSTNWSGASGSSGSPDAPLAGIGHIWVYRSVLQRRSFSLDRGHVMLATCSYVGISQPPNLAGCACFLICVWVHMGALVGPSVDDSSPLPNLRQWVNLRQGRLEPLGPMLEHGERLMAGDLTAIADGGFRHVVEEGLSLLKGQQLPSERRDYVLERLTTLLREAAVGSQVVARGALFIGSKERDAYESFSLLERHLGHRPGWRELLKRTEEALEALKSAPTAPTQIDPAASQLLEELRGSLRRAGVGGIRSLPEEIEFRRW
jgi:hypothetical protein